MLKEKIQNDLKDSLKTGDKTKRLVLGMLNASIKNRELLKRGQLSKTVSDTIELEKQSQLNDEEVLEVITSEVKKRKESIEQFKLGGRQELVEKESAELENLLGYLPEQLSEDQIKQEVQQAITGLGINPDDSVSGPRPERRGDMGKIIGAVMAKLKGRADGTVVSKIVKEMLSSN